MALVQSDATFFNDAGDDAWFGGAGTDGANAVAAAFGDVINFRAHFGGGEESVFAAVHRRAAGMRGLAVKSNGMAFHAECSEHRAERQIQIQKHGALFDVQFQIGGGVFQFRAAILDALKINTHFSQRVRQRMPSLSLSPRASSRFNCRNRRTSRTDFCQNARLLRPPSPRDAR